MAKTLVLAEKPSVGKELARVLGCRRGGEGCLEGERYIVTWALGHLVELAPPEAYDKAWEKWDLLTLPMLPEHMKTAVIKETGRQFRAVQALMRRGTCRNWSSPPMPAGRGTGSPVDHGESGMEQARQAAVDILPDRQGHPGRLFPSAPCGRI
ncbi:MAG: hypothetical protein ACLSAF_09870 [Intestinimonas sp.]